MNKLALKIIELAIRSQRLTGVHVRQPRSKKRRIQLKWAKVELSLNTTTLSWLPGTRTGRLSSKSDNLVPWKPSSIQLEIIRILDTPADARQYVPADYAYLCRPKEASVECKGDGKCPLCALGLPGVNYLTVFDVVTQKTITVTVPQAVIDMLKPHHEDILTGTVTIDKVVDEHGTTTYKVREPA